MNLYNLKLHEREQISTDLFVTRVPGGWIYDFCACDSAADSTTFVPFNDEFSDQKINRSKQQ